MFENPRRGRLARNFAKNVQKILDLKSSFEQIFSENYIVVGCPWQTPSESANHNNFFGDFCGDSFKTWKSRSNLSSVNHVLPCHLLQQTVTGNSLLNTVANNSLRKHPFLLALHRWGRHQYGISAAESQTFLLAKRPRRRRARRNGCFRCFRRLSQITNLGHYCWYSIDAKSVSCPH